MSFNKGKEKLTRSFAKAVSWRALGSVDTFLLGWLFTGNVKAAGGIAATEVLTKIFLYTGHERVWNHIGWGKAKTPEQPPLTPAQRETPTPAQRDNSPPAP